MGSRNPVLRKQNIGNVLPLSLNGSTTEVKRMRGNNDEEFMLTLQFDR